MRKLLAIVAMYSLSSSLSAAQMQITVEIPTQIAAEVATSYQPPNVAFWIEHLNQRTAAQLSLWSGVTQAQHESLANAYKPLVNLREWWRAGGRALTLPMDGFSSATRPPGFHQMVFNSQSAPLATLAPGRYVLVVEAARALGGHDIVRIPFRWPPRQTASWQEHGDSELASIRLTLMP